KPKNISLVLERWAPFDMIGSKEGKENLFAKLGMNISSFSNVQESGVENYAQLVKGIKNAKGILSSINKKVAPRNKGKALAQERETPRNKGKALV
ncbi:hypothetical protein, partial [Escherichia coli]|uniref:hypothetical protein n=1 Tax=Escherichia coli TaxID=562 RepID=UPI00142D2245